jgi:hypothetical protein
MQVNLQKLSRDVALACRRRAVPMPIFVSVVSPNGSFVVIHVGLDETTILGERIQHNGLCEPFKVMFLDQSGKAVQLATNGGSNGSPPPVDMGRRRRSSSREVRVAQSREGLSQRRSVG